MPRITVVISNLLDERLRKYTKRKGDLSKIAEVALNNWVNYAEELEAKK
jgi:hypothetical protein